MLCVAHYKASFHACITENNPDEETLGTWQLNLATVTVGTWSSDNCRVALMDSIMCVLQCNSFNMASVQLTGCSRFTTMEMVIMIRGWGAVNAEVMFTG